MSISEIADYDTPVKSEQKPKSAYGLIGLPRLMSMAFEGGQNAAANLAAIGDQLLARIKTDPADANALMDLAVLFILRGDTQLALTMQMAAIAQNPLFHYPRPGMPVKIRALAILGPGDLMANSPFEFLIENQPIALDMLYITPTQGLPEYVPEHDVLIVAIGESDINQPLLHYLETKLHRWPRPVVNLPQRISELSRDIICERLTDTSSTPGIVMPPTLRVSRDILEKCCQAEETAVPLSAQLSQQGQLIDYPVIIRPIDSHAGKGLNKIESVSDLTGYLANSTEPMLFVAPFIDYRSSDGLFRKYRIILMNGKPYACHMAISRRWMVHYLNADMLENVSHRTEEALFMANFQTDFALRHAADFAVIHAQTGLNYVGIDCAETPDGKLLVFEIDSNMVVHNMDSADMFPYKKSQMPKVFTGFTELLSQQAKVKL